VKNTNYAGLSNPGFSASFYVLLLLLISKYSLQPCVLKDPPYIFFIVSKRPSFTRMKRTRK
jgi:hypothetical protein